MIDKEGTEYCDRCGIAFGQDRIEKMPVPYRGKPLDKDWAIYTVVDTPLLPSPQPILCSWCIAQIENVEVT